TPTDEPDCRCSLRPFVAKPFVSRCSPFPFVIRHSSFVAVASLRARLASLHRFTMPEAVAGPAERALPHNLEAERSVFGAVLIHNEAFNHAVEIVAPGDFFRDAHRRIFEKMIVLGDRSEAIDLVTLKEALAQAGELDQVGGPAYIASLVDGVPRSTNIEYYARIGKEKSTLRALIH